MIFNWQEKLKKKKKKEEAEGKRCFIIQFGAKITSVHFKWHEMTQHGAWVVLFITEAVWVSTHLLNFWAFWNLGARNDVSPEQEIQETPICSNNAYATLRGEGGITRG